MRDDATSLSCLAGRPCHRPFLLVLSISNLLRLLGEWLCWRRTRWVDSATRSVDENVVVDAVDEERVDFGVTGEGVVGSRGRGEAESGRYAADEVAADITVARESVANVVD